MEKNYNAELDFILEELVEAYKNHFKGIKFYSEESHRTTKEEITEKLRTKFNLKDWEVNLLCHNLLIDKYINHIDPLTISLDGVIFIQNGGYTQKALRLNSENLRIQKLEKYSRQNSFGTLLFTGLLAFGTLVSAWYFAIEIWRYYYD